MRYLPCVGCIFAALLSYGCSAAQWNRAFNEKNAAVNHCIASALLKASQPSPFPVSNGQAFAAAAQCRANPVPDGNTPGIQELRREQDLFKQYQQHLMAEPWNGSSCVYDSWSGKYRRSDGTYWFTANCGQ